MAVFPRLVHAPSPGGRARAGSLGHPWRQGGPGAAGRRSSLQPCRPRRRTDSITIYAESEEGEDVTSTSYGPVVSKHAGDAGAGTLD